jgi:myo-inositol-1(or 4)-monophosphatase
MDLLTSEPLAAYLDIATEAALAGGAILMRYWGKLEHIREKGRSGDLLTEADQAAEAAVLAVLTRHFPEHALLAEESGSHGDDQSRYCWAIDPLDGTTNYAHQYPLFACSVGLLIDGTPQVGVVYAPYLNELFRAARGLGATLNRHPMQVSQTTELGRSLLVTGFAYDRHEVVDNNYAEFCQLTHLTQGVRRGGSAAIDLAYVACGRLDGYWERGLSPWDLAAGVVLVQEAGGRVTAYDQSPFDLASGRILATNSQIHAVLSETLSQVSPLATF